MKEYGLIYANIDLSPLLYLYTWCFSMILVYGKTNELALTTNNTELSETSEGKLGTNAEDEAIFKELREQGLYYDFDTVINDINAQKFRTGIVDLMSVHNRSEWISRMRHKLQAKDQIKKKKRMIFINVETVYSSKREMITKGLARRLKGKKMTSPPKFMSDIRVILGPGIARRMYYSITKYSTAHHIEQVLSTHAVVLERYWLHHAAFIIGKAFNDSNLPPPGHPIYKWPKDLLAPDVVFFVNATKQLGPETGFNQPFTPFTERLIQVFRRVQGVMVVELNPSQNYNSIVNYILNFVKNNFKDHPDIMVPS